MAHRLLLWVSWICFLLFDGSVGVPAIKGYGYPYKSDSRNIGDDEEDDVLTSPTYGQGNWQGSNIQPTGPVYTSYHKPTVAQQPAEAPAQQNPLHTQSGSKVEVLVNGVSRDWGLENSDKPLVFPLLSDPAKPQQGPSHSQSAASMNSKPASPSAIDSTYTSQTTHNAQSSTSQAAVSPSYVSWQPWPENSGYVGVHFSTDSVATGGKPPHLVFEDIFQYPENAELSSSDVVSNMAGEYSQPNDMSEGSPTDHAVPVEEPSFPGFQTNAGPQPLYPSGTGSVPGKVDLNFGQTDYQPRDEKPVISTEKVEVFQRVRRPIPPPPLPSSYIVQSRNGYQRGQYFMAKTKYSPEFSLPMPVRSKGVKGPAPSQPAAPKGVKNFERVKW